MLDSITWLGEIKSTEWTYKTKLQKEINTIDTPDYLVIYKLD